MTLYDGSTIFNGTLANNMDITISHKIQNYLMWQLDRGQIWPKYFSFENKPSGCVLKDRCLPPITSPVAVESNYSFDEIFISKGSESARIFGVVDCIRGQEIVFGGERELLIKILKALKLNLKFDFRLLGIVTDSCCKPKANAQDYQLHIKKIADEHRPLAIISFGMLAHKLLSNENIHFTESVNQVTNIHSKTSSFAYLPLHHLQNIRQNPNLKRGTWVGLQEIQKLMSQ